MFAVNNTTLRRREMVGSFVIKVYITFFFFLEMSNLCICTTHCLPDAQPQKLLKIFVKRGQRAKTLDSILAAVVNVSIHSGNKKKKKVHVATKK